MTTTSDRAADGPSTTLRGRAMGLLRGSGVLAAAIVVMNLATYSFQIISAHVLGPEEYGGLTSLMNLLLVVAVVQLGLQATAARRIAATPSQVGQIERVVLRVTYRAAFAVGALMLVLSPVVERVLKLDSIAPAILLAVAAVPLTMMGGQAGVLQGERRWVALSVLYLTLGIPRLVVGGIVIAVRPTEGAALFGVMLAQFAPAVVGWLALRTHRPDGEQGEDNRARATLREVLHSSMGLFAFFALSNLDIVVARNVLDKGEAGLYAGGLILTKAVLFLPQFVVVAAFPSLSTVSQRRRALFGGLGLTLGLGAISTVGALVLSSLAILFVGGADSYGDIEGRLWLFAIVGTLLSMLQLLVYSVLARQGARSAYLVWVAVAALLAASTAIDTLTGLIVTVASVDGCLFVVLFSLALWHLRTDVAGDVEDDADAVMPPPAIGG